jgi:transposase-like protein
MEKSRVGLDELFKGRHLEREIIVLCVQWYLRFKLGFRDLVEMMAERGLSLAHTTILRWVQGFAPEFERSWSRFARQSGDSWRVDETYIKIRGVWTYLYRAIGTMLGFKRFRRAKVTIAGIERLHRIRKNQFDLSKLQIQINTATMWDAVLAA